MNTVKIALSFFFSISLLGGCQSNENKGVDQLLNRITFEDNSGKGKYIKLSEAKEYMDEFNKIRQKPEAPLLIQSMESRYVSVANLQRLIDRVDTNDFVELSFGLKGNIVKLILTAVDSVDSKQSMRMYKDKPKPGAVFGKDEDVLDDLRPCPSPPCPTN